MSAHTQQMRRYRRPRGSQPNHGWETVSPYQQVRVPSHPRSPSTASYYEDSHGPTTATSPQDPTTHTHANAHTSVQGHRPANGLW